ncbi:major capsid protein VP54 [Paramecium bursaria Chlorella virus NE-JV-1]|nr:major capsid protein VP54 [Paramecium bursaria Chlorella virus NE-JV-1]
MSLTQLIASTPIDTFLYGLPRKNPVIARFSSRVPYATEMIRMDLEYQIPGRGTILVPRRGDLLSSIFLQIKMKRSTTNGTQFFPVENLVNRVRMYIGGQLVEHFTNDYIRIHNALFTDNTQKDSIITMEEFESSDSDGMIRSLWMNLPFWFNKLSFAIPLIALQYHEVRFEFEFTDVANIPGVDPSFIPQITAWGEYVFLPAEERVSFVSKPHEYIIEQTQTQDFNAYISTKTSLTTSYTLPFNLPVKYLLFVFRNENVFGIYSGDTSVGLSANDKNTPLLSSKLQLNGIDRMEEQIGSYFRLVEPYRTMLRSPPAGIYSYFFSSQPQNVHAPSGTLNFSALDTVKLVVKTKVASAATSADVKDEETCTVATANLSIFTVIARSMNVLRVENGQGGILFAN